MRNTEYFNLNVPEYGDTADINPIGANFETIDTILNTAYSTCTSISNAIDIGYFADYNSYHSDFLEVMANKDDIIKLTGYTSDLVELANTLTGYTSDLPELANAKSDLLEVAKLSGYVSSLQSLAESTADIGYVLTYAEELNLLGSQYDTIQSLLNAYGAVYSDPADLADDWTYLAALHEKDKSNKLKELGYNLHWQQTTDEELTNLVGLAPYAATLTQIIPSLDPEIMTYLKDVYEHDTHLKLPILVGYSYAENLISISDRISISPADSLVADVLDLELSNSTWHGDMSSLKDVIDDIYGSSGGTDTNVTQTESSDNAAYEIILSGTADDTTRTEGTHKSEYFTFNPSSKSITVGSRDTNVVGNYSIAVGENNDAKALNGVAIGHYVESESIYGVAIGLGAKSRHRSQFVFGEYNITDNKPGATIPFDRGNYIEIVGNGLASTARSNARTLDWDGNEYLSNSITIGTRADASTVGQYSISAGTSNTISGISSSGFGRGVMASGNYSHAEGFYTTASGTSSHAEGNYSMAKGSDAHAEGTNTTAFGNYSHAEGDHTFAEARAHAEGHLAQALGQCSHAEGVSTVAEGYASHASGTNTNAAGKYSHTEGYYTTANHRSQHVFGEYNIVDASTATASDFGTYVEIVGNGLSSTQLANARTLDWSGNEWLASNLELGGASSDIILSGTNNTWDGTHTSLKAALSAILARLS